MNQAADRPDPPGHGGSGSTGLAPSASLAFSRRRRRSIVARQLLDDMGAFSRHVIDLPLYGYQAVPMASVAESVVNRHGDQFLLVFPRQSGKNEAVAQLLVYLLNLLHRKGGNMIFGATGDGLGRGLARLESRLDNPLDVGRWRKQANPTRLVLDKAAVVFLSTHPAAAARGETAHWLLVIDELQDLPATHVEAVFEPMRAANNATALYIGTVKSTVDALWLKKLALEGEERHDGRRRVFVVPPENVIAANPAYGRFLHGKVARFGRHHPIVASEYFNEPIDGHGGLFDDRRLALIRGTHRRQRSLDDVPAQIGGKATAIIATLDVGGQDEAATDPLARLDNPGRDYTVAHVFAAAMERPDDPGPTYYALDVFVDQGGRHFQASPGRPPLAERLLAWLRRWDVAHLVADASGVGAGLVDWLSARLGRDRVTGFAFSPVAKAGLGCDFLGVVETGRFRYWAGDEVPLSDGWWFYQQAMACRYSVPPDGRFERDLRWGVPAQARVDTPAGSLPVHDDRLISAALVAVFDDLYRQNKVRMGRAASALVLVNDPLDELRH